MMITKTILIFFIYSFIGWISEILFCFTLSGRITNRGFMYGPVCPIYGVGSLLIITTLNRFIEYPFLIFTFGMVFATILEYLTSVIMEKLFSTRWWDYSKYRYHFQGRICLVNSLSFGLGSLIIMYLVHPLVQKGLSYLSMLQMAILAITISIFYLLDYCLTFYSALQYKKIRLTTNLEQTFPTKYIVNHFRNNYPYLKE